MGRWIFKNLPTYARNVQQLAYFAQSWKPGIRITDRTRRSGMTTVDSGLLILADDLSGAAEAAATLGSAARIHLSGPAAGGPSETDDSVLDLAVDLDCRYLSPAKASLRTKHAWESHRADQSRPDQQRTTLIKIDSLLRGNVPALLETALETTDTPVILAPALPQLGRTIVDGMPIIDGVRLAETDAWSVEDSPAPESLHDLCPRPAFHLTLDRLRTATSEELRDISRGNRLIIADAESMSDISAIVDLAVALNATLVGTAALARAFAAKRSISAPTMADSPRSARSSVLTVLGTAAERARAQVDDLAAHHPVEVIDLPASALSSWTAEDPDLQTAANRVRAGLAAGHVVVRIGDDGRTVDPRPLPGLLAELTARALDATEPAGGDTSVPEDQQELRPVDLVASGGETARAVLDRLGVGALDVTGEIHPGAVLSEVTATSAGIAPRLNRVVTRPGNQGEVSSLTLIHEVLTGVGLPQPTAIPGTTKENE